MTTDPTNPLTLLESLDAKSLRNQLDELYRREGALRVLLRAVEERDALTNARRPANGKEAAVPDPGRLPITVRPDPDVLRRELIEQGIDPDSASGRWLCAMLAYGERAKAAASPPAEPPSKRRTTTGKK